MIKLLAATIATAALLLAGPTRISPANANSWWTYGCLQGMQQKYGSRFDQQQMQGYCNCRDKGKRSSDECIQYLGLDKQSSSSGKLSNEEEFTIGVMTTVICAKRLGNGSLVRSDDILISALSGQGFPLELATKEALWAEAYQEVGEGLAWCKKNQ
jgi:hypothetical protein